MKEQLIQPKSTVIISLLCFLLVAARVTGQALPFPEELSVKDATKLIKSHEMFKTLQTIQINTGEIPARISDIERYQPQYVAFKAMGLIELSTVKVEFSDPQTSRFPDRTLVSLTEKGKSESKKWKQNRENEWEMPIAIRELVELKKIHYDEETPVGIEFSWTYIPNKMGEALKFTYQTEKAYASIQPSEDGWKIIRIRALSS